MCAACVLLFISQQFFYSSHDTHLTNGNNHITHTRSIIGTVLTHTNVSSYLLFETEFLSRIIQFMKCYDFLDSQIRKAEGDHVLRVDEESFREAFFLIHDVMSIGDALVAGVRAKLMSTSDLKTRTEYVRRIFNVLRGTNLHSEVSLAFEGNNRSSGQEEEEDWKVLKLEYGVSHNLVSFHIPTQRFALQIIVELLRWLPETKEDSLYMMLNRMENRMDKNQKKSVTKWNEKHVLNIVDVALCPLVFSKQILSDMWTRNGTIMFSQVSLYYSRFWNYSGLDMDIFALQFGISYLGANRVLAQMIQRFEVLDFFLCDSTPSSSSYSSKMAESFLSLVATLVTDRRHVGHSTERMIRQEIIQRLALKKMTYVSGCCFECVCV